MDDESESKNTVGWETYDNKFYVPSGPQVKGLPPGLYKIVERGMQWGPERQELKTDGIISFKGDTSEKVVQEINNFWKKEALFKAFNISFKRGILLYGPPGTGKSTILMNVIKSVFELGGLGLNFTSPNHLLHFIQQIRRFQPDIPIVVLMEDLDSIMQTYNNSDILNLLDGVHNLHKIVFLATTNYLEKIEDRIKARPSRFDKRFLIGMPCDRVRRTFLDKLSSLDTTVRIDLEQWVRDTDTFALAHIKELFINCVILGTPYYEALETIKGLKIETDIAAPTPVYDPND